MNQQRVSLVTGGSRGIGRDIAINLASTGHDVIISYHTNRSAADEVISIISDLGQSAHAIHLDVSDLSSRNTFVTELRSLLSDQYDSDRIDYLINNAGTGLSKPIADISEADFDEMLGVHFKGVYFLTQAMIPMLADGGGIVNISSGLTRFSFQGMSAYACMKGAIEVFTRYCAKELADRHIRANTIAPGAVATDFGGGANRDNEKKRQIISNITALGRVGEVDDIGGVVAFLCSDQAGWINGQHIEISGGMLL